MTYNEAYNKIIDAYFKDEIKPNSRQFCFCGTLSNGHRWHDAHEHAVSSLPYAFKEYGRMEKALFSPFSEVKVIDGGYTTPFGANIHLRVDYEDRLFEGMCAALDVLKEIHRGRGEDVDAMPALTKRKLAIQ